MTKVRVKIILPAGLVATPLVYRLGKDFNLVTNIRRASITGDHGWVILELDGPSDEIDRALASAMALGAGVEQVQDDTPMAIEDREGADCGGRGH